MAKVRILTDRVANQIAAGEVIERPAAVVKELVENALDAGATRIEVEFRHGGRSLMRIEDNGSGMSRDDALLALERHATSKIAEAADLDRLASYGFRGEALPSIASVSRFQLQTREAGSDAGSEILVNGGKFVHVRDCGRPVGTCIEVSHLFNSVPARRKFLKTDQTEAAHIVQCVRLYALACPRTAFTLIEDGRVIFRSPKCTTLGERIAEIFGRQIADSLVPIESGEPGLRLSGLIGRPGVGRTTRHEMIVFVNARPVDSRTLNYALIESYHESLPKGRYPLAFVFFECDPAAVDVNVHPAKREVRFHRPLDLKEVILEAVALGLKPPAPVIPARVEPSAVVSTASEAVEMAPARTVFHAPQPLLEHWNNPENLSVEPKPVTGKAPRNGAPDFRVMGMLHHRFVILESEDGLVLFDPKAAWERIFYEKLLNHGDGVLETQGLLVPVLLELDPRDLDLVLRERMTMQDSGIEVEAFGGNTLQIRSLPACLPVDDPRPFLGALMDELLHGAAPGARFAIDRLSRVLAKRASALVIPKLSETRDLLANLFACELPYCAADGRPTLTEFGMRELERRFGCGKG